MFCADSTMSVLSSLSCTAMVDCVVVASKLKTAEFNFTLLAPPMLESMALIWLRNIISAIIANKGHRENLRNISIKLYAFSVISNTLTKTL